MRAYEPEIVSIGPYHHGKENLKKMEKHKLWYLQQFLKRRNETSVDRYVKALRGLEKRARNCYAESIEQFNEDEFLKMMLLDGCFIIELFEILSVGDFDPGELIFELDLVLASIGHDLLLFENQLPFFIIVRLLNYTNVLPTTGDYILLLALNFLGYIFQSENYFDNFRISADNVDHLLGLMYYSWCYSFSLIVSHREREGNVRNQELELIKCTTELRNAGIKFEMFTGSASLLDIRFENGVMKIPPFTVTDKTEFLLRNLIAYEQYLLGIYNRYVTDYVFFMDGLVNSAKDAEKLRHYGILNNWLGDDEVVSIMFNKICNEICITPTKFCYCEVFQNVNKHCRKRVNIWLAKLRRNYFKSPWTTISFLAAVSLLILTLVQTVFAILSYVK